MIGTLMFDRTITVALFDTVAGALADAGLAAIVGLFVMAAVGFGLARHRRPTLSSSEVNLGDSFGVDREAA